MLSKVVEEFEHRIASQYDLVFYFSYPKNFNTIIRNFAWKILFSPIQYG